MIARAAALTLVAIAAAPTAAAHYETAFDVNGDQYCGDQDTSDFNSHAYPAIVLAVATARDTNPPYDALDGARDAVDEAWPDGIIEPFRGPVRDVIDFVNTIVIDVTAINPFPGLRVLQTHYDTARRVLDEKGLVPVQDPNVPFQDYEPIVPRPSRGVWDAALHVHHGLCLRDYYTVEPTPWLKAIIKNVVP